MTNKLITILLAIGCFVLGGYLGAQYQVKSLTPEEVDSTPLVEQFSEVDFSECEQGQAINPACVDDLLIDEAIATKSLDICLKLSNNDVQVSCMARVNRLSALENNQLCAGITREDICQDLGFFLQARETNTVSPCSLILDNDLAALCRGNAEPTQEELISITGETPRLFGPGCNEAEDTACAGYITTFASAVSSQDAQVCLSLTDQDLQRLCQYEVRFKSLYDSETSAGCSSFESPEGCLSDFITSMAIKKQDASRCQSHENPELVTNCESLVLVASGGRYDYLQAE